MINKFLILIIIILFSGRIFGQEKEIIEVLETQQKAWNNGNLEEFMNGYWNSKSLMFIGLKGPTYGWQNTLENYKKSYPDKSSMGILEFSDVQVKMLGKDYATVFGKWKLIREKDTPNGIYTLVFQKFKNGWKIIQDHTQ